VRRIFTFEGLRNAIVIVGYLIWFGYLIENFHQPSSEILKRQIRPQKWIEARRAYGPAKSLTKPPIKKCVQIVHCTIKSRSWRIFPISDAGWTLKPTNDRNRITRTVFHKAVKGKYTRRQQENLWAPSFILPVRCGPSPH
jgi:hypothetical protein